MSNEELIELVRAFLGNISDEDLPDSIILLFYNKWKISLDVANHPERMPLVIYNTVVDCVRWLIVQEVASGASSFTERLEKIGDETISVKGGSSLKSWQDFLDWLLANPDFIDPSLAFNSSLVIIGGVRQDRVRGVRNNPNSYNGFMEQGIYPTPAISKRAAWPSGSGGYRSSPWTR